MNHTKWDEIRLAMYGLGELTPDWRTKDLSGYISDWDRGWYYHFRAGGYESIEWLEIRVTSSAQESAVLAALVAVHVPGEPFEEGYRVYGYAASGKAIGYL